LRYLHTKISFASYLIQLWPGLFSRLVQLDKFDNIRSIHPRQRPIAVATGDNLVIRADDEFRRLNQSSPLFPKRAYRIANFASRAVTNRKRHIVRHFLRLIQRVGAGCDNRRIQRVKFRLQFFKAD
jgi:hypothetical protein